MQHFDHIAGWAAGELSDRLAMRSDVEQVAFSSLRIENMLVTPQGSLRPAPGTRLDDVIADEARLFSMVSSTGLSYAIVVDTNYVRVYREGALEAEIATMLWPSAALATLDAVQLNDAVYLICETVPVKILRRVAVDSWTLGDWEWAVDSTRNGRAEPPRAKFVDSAVTLQASAVSGEVTLTARARKGGDLYAAFQAGHVGLQFFLDDKAVTITAIGEGGTTATATTIEDVSTTETDNWTEPAISVVRGYVRGLAFFQDRAHLVPAGAPNMICVSETSRHSGFAQQKADGTVLATHGMTLRLLRDTRYQSIVNMQSRANELVVATSAGLAAIRAAGASSGYSPLNREIVWLSDIGARPGTKIVNVAEAAVYVPSDGRAVYEYALSNESGGVTNLTALSEHLFLPGVRKLARLAVPYPLLWALLDDGTLVCMTHSAQDGVFAPVRYSCAPGTVEDIVPVSTDQGDTLAMKVVYGSKSYLAEMRPLLPKGDRLKQLQLGQDGEVETPSTVWSGLDVFPEGTEVTVVADDTRVYQAIVSECRVTLPEPASKVEVGFFAGATWRSRLVHGPDPAAAYSVRVVRVEMHMQCCEHVPNLTLRTSGADPEIVWLRQLDHDYDDGLVVWVTPECQSKQRQWIEVTMAFPLDWELTSVGVLLDAERS